jgi:hypothetical protein
MLRFLTVLGVMRLSRSSKMRPMRRAPEAARFTLAPVPFEVSLSWTASNRAGVTIGACSPGLARALVVELAHIEPIPQDMGDLRLWVQVPQNVLRTRSWGCGGSAYSAKSG